MSGIGQGKSENANSLLKGNRRPITMPTRERILALIDILKDFDADHPLKKQDVSVLLYHKYSIYLLSQLYSLLPDNSNSKDIRQAKRIINELKEDSNNQIAAFEHDHYLIDIQGKSTGKILDNSKRYEKLVSLKKLVKGFVNTDTLDNILNVLSEGRPVILSADDSGNGVTGKADSKKDNVQREVAYFAPGTLSEDFKALTHEDYLFAEICEDSESNHANWGIYGNYLFNNLDIWQLKLIFEAIIGIPFLQLQEIEAISDSIRNSTGVTLHKDAKSLSIYHKLDDEYYSSSPNFSNNLRLLINALMSENNVSFNYQYSEVNRKKNPDAHAYSDIFPVDIVFKDNFFYLLGADNNKVRPYRIDRIIDLKQAGANYGFMTIHPEYAEEKELFFKNNTNNFSGGDPVDVTVRWDMNYLGYYTPYTPLFDVFGYENISQPEDAGLEEDEFIIKTRDNYGMYLNLLRLGPVIEVVAPQQVRERYAGLVRKMHDKHK